MSSVCDSDWSRDYHDDTGSRVALSGTRFVSWVAITLFPRDDPQPVRNDELMILYAMVNKIRVSSAKAIVKQWLTNFRMTGPGECICLVTHIVSNIGILEGNPVPFIEDDCVLIDEFLFGSRPHTQEKPEWLIGFLFLGLCKWNSIAKHGISFV